ncbi:MotA/TolQ/ExbB proton channel family protein [Polyangium jinanense]|uniref:MotA/TolQ/ExbB proton channel family protein n=1 Tax=Polyangium jinanense TaxID=2829994 RepID=A0A9X4B0S1_9BACT|nr:MotA/TolQ/ExbB proton channel family protein [Polyangium jinanense]MDC3959147.1 MotA/TolQ/ExbB proton channel family protein [Polyangium jinanense]MDC3989452.1 MotA/TolQ/ExbB proton channel family protein [Polyangium jinanense]
MNLIEWLQRIMVGFGAAWVMWLMIGLSVVSVAIILERAWFFWSLRDDVVVLARDLRNTLKDSIEAAQKRMEASPSAEAAVVKAGLVEADRGPKAAEEAMAGALALQRMKLERRLAYLGTLGNNAPFIGLFGTVIGVVGAFDALGKAAEKPMAQAASAAMAPQQVMSSIAEALVATAVGLAVAIPAVAANNYFQRLIRSTIANTDALTRVLLAHLHGEKESAIEEAASDIALAVAAKKTEAAKPAKTNGAQNKKAAKKGEDEEESSEENG